MLLKFVQSPKTIALAQISGFLFFCYLFTFDGDRAPLTLVGRLIADYFSRNPAVVLVHGVWMLFYLLCSGIMARFFDPDKHVRRGFQDARFGPHLLFGVALGFVIMFLRNAFMLSSAQWQQAGTNFGAHVATFPWLLVGLSILFVAVGEEVAFRGTVYGLARRDFSPMQSVWISGAFFGLLHIANGSYDLGDAVLILLRAGLLLGASRWLTGSIYLAIGIHFGQDFLGIFWFGDKSMQVEPLVALKAWGDMLGFAARLLLPYAFPVLVAWWMLHQAKVRDARDILRHGTQRLTPEPDPG